MSGFVKIMSAGWDGGAGRYRSIFSFDSGAEGFAYYSAKLSHDLRQQPNKSAPLSNSKDSGVGLLVGVGFFALMGIFNNNQAPANTPPPSVRAAIVPPSAPDTVTRKLPAGTQGGEEFAPNAVVATKSTSLSLRSTPNSDGLYAQHNFMLPMPRGSSLYIIQSVGNDWYEVSYRTDDGRMLHGYAASQYVTPNASLQASLRTATN